MTTETYFLTIIEVAFSTHKIDLMCTHAFKLLYI